MFLLFFFLQIPTCAPSTPSVSQSCPKICSWRAASVGNVLNCCGMYNQGKNGVFKHHRPAWNRLVLMVVVVGFDSHACMSV